ncbi:ATP-binding cassette domain-containing protein [Epibacterium ulvae]|uniref:ATP-binding cassette domain-containing protein n=1 Tax=Epibacterium ulvae TaxID=1156985 RepID=UPI001BFC184B|nr:ATP-binding cassette domain-containing protein [Epibacterium ulvae]MBT8154089.1 ATP-binding cassette domain-containing protein [Epibacterium ulvae]
MGDRIEQLLTLTGVSKSFPGVLALDDVTLQVQAGEVHGLVGENGAGKSTLMAVASGALTPTNGTIAINGTQINSDPEQARALGLAIVRQEPALMPDLTVAENFYLGVPAQIAPPMSKLAAWSRDLLSGWSDDVGISPSDRVDTLNPEQRFIVEIVKALASEPKVLVLDEPTEHLSGDDVKRLFERVRSVTARGACVVYISHRLKEVRDIADRLTVLRDGQGQGTYDVATLSEDDVVRLIVGRDLEEEFPTKAATLGPAVVEIEGLTGQGFSDANLTVRKGEILGLGGISENGQLDFLRALAGLNAPNHGKVRVGGDDVRLASVKRAMKHGLSYLPGDRQREGIFADLTVRENFTSRSPASDMTLGLVSRSSEGSRTQDAISQYAVKTPGSETPIGFLSGGNQQKLVLASVVATGAKVLLVDEPTQGVDVGARAEIYKTLRGLADDGVSIVVLSSDAAELAGLCDSIAVFSRGQIVEMLGGDDVTEENITGAALRSTAVRAKVGRSVNKIWSWAAGDAAPIVMIGAAIIALGLLAAAYNPFYMSTRNFGGMLVLIATLAMVAYGQQMLMLVGGIDLSVGPLMGLVQVVASFYLIDGAGLGTQMTGWAAMLAIAVAVGLTNWCLVEPLRLHPMVATLATYMGVQAVSLLLRPTPGGMLEGDLMFTLGTRIGWVPVMFIVALLLAILLDLLLFKGRFGLTLRGLGSQPEAARVAGITPARVRLMAYVGCSVLTFFAAVAMMEQVGIGDPRAGLSYTLASIAAVVIGGGSLFGGRGSFIGALLGAAFIIQVNTVTNFLGLNAAWQSYLLGVMIIVAVALYSKSRQMVVAG